MRTNDDKKSFYLLVLDKQIVWTGDARSCKLNFVICNYPGAILFKVENIELLSAGSLENGKISNR